MNFLAAMGRNRLTHYTFYIASWELRHRIPWEMFKRDGYNPSVTLKIEDDRGKDQEKASHQLELELGSQAYLLDYYPNSNTETGMTD